MTSVTLTTRLAAPADWVWAEVNKPATLLFVAHPILQFRPIDPPVLAERWEEGDHLFSLKWYGFVPLGQQAIKLSRPEPKDGVRFLRDNGHSALIWRWDHLVSVAPDGNRTLYTDQVVVDAGFLTPVVAAFARRFYAYRQKRWQQLVAADYNAAPFN